MKALAYVVAIMAGVGILWVPILFAQDNETVSFYEEKIDQVISKCERKATLRDADSESIRYDADLSAVKRDFYKSHKDELIDEMATRNLPCKRGDVDYFLVKSFDNFVKTHLAKTPDGKVDMTGYSTE